MRTIWSYLLLLLNQNPSGLILTLSSECNTRAECAWFSSSVSPSDDILLFILPHLIKIKACGASNAIRIVLKIWKGSPDGKWLSEAVWGDQRRTRIIFHGLFWLAQLRGILSFTGQKTTVNRSNQSFILIHLLACFGSLSCLTVAISFFSPSVTFETVTKQVKISLICMVQIVPEVLLLFRNVPGLTVRSTESLMLCFQLWCKCRPSCWVCW